MFGGIERGTTHSFMVVVPDRSADTLLPIIQRYIRPGTVTLIISDAYEWRAYCRIPSLGYTHQTVNHSQKLCEPCHRGSHKQHKGLLVLCEKAAEEARGYEHLITTVSNIPLKGNVEKEVFWGRPF